MEKRKKINREQIIKLKGLKRISKILSVMGIVFSIIMIAIICYLFIYTTYNYKTHTPKELAGNDVVVEYVSTINDYNIVEAKETIELTKHMDIIFVMDIVIPTIFVLMIFILLILFCKRSIDFFRDINSKKALFTNEKLDQLRNNIDILLVLSVFVVLSLNLLAFVLYFALIFVRQFVLFLFKNCVDMNKKIENKEI